MMRRILAGLLLMLLMGSSAYAADPDPESRYQALLASAKARALGVDWQALRFAYADRPTFNVFNDGLNAPRMAMMKAFSDGNSVEALKQANLIIDQDYVDGEAHFVAELAYKKLGQNDAAAREQAITRGLFGSIQTGDGLTAKTAFTVISVSEEYSLMRVTGRRVGGQELVKQDGHVFDVLDTVDRQGLPGKFYFVIDRVMAAESKQMAFKH